MAKKLLRDEQWKRIKDLLPGNVTDPEVAGKDNGLFVEELRYMPLAIRCAGDSQEDTPGDITQAASLIAGLATTAVMGDKGYDVNALIAYIEQMGAQR